MGEHHCSGEKHLIQHPIQGSNHTCATHGYRYRSESVITMENREELKGEAGAKSPPGKVPFFGGWDDLFLRPRMEKVTSMTGVFPSGTVCGLSPYPYSAECRICMCTRPQGSIVKELRWGRNGRFRERGRLGGKMGAGRQQKGRGRQMDGSRKRERAAPVKMSRIQRRCTEATGRKEEHRHLIAFNEMRHSRLFVPMALPYY